MEVRLRASSILPEFVLHVEAKFLGLCQDEKPKTLSILSNTFRNSYKIEPKSIQE